MSFFGNRRHPHGMGPLMRLCLHHGIEAWFIPMAEPWRNGMIENFNDRYQKMFLKKNIMNTEKELHIGSLAFEQRHNNQYRYSKMSAVGLKPATIIFNVVFYHFHFFLCKRYFSADNFSR